MPEKSRIPKPPKPRTRGLSRFRRSETSRLLKGALDAGLPVRGLEADPATGVVRVLVGKPDEPGNDLDNWLKKKDAHQA